MTFDRRLAKLEARLVPTAVAGGVPSADVARFLTLPCEHAPDDERVWDEPLAPWRRRFLAGFGAPARTGTGWRWGSYETATATSYENRNRTPQPIP